MTFQQPDVAYWDRKFIAYMHDPFDKIFQIQGHEKRSTLILEKFGLQKTNEEFWKKADGIAAGFERGQVPSYSADPNQNGAVDFLQNPIITHPTSQQAQLRIEMPGQGSQEAERIFQELLEFMEKDIGMKPGQGGYSDRFKNQDDRFAMARFLYTHLVLRFKLAERNIGGLGGFWHRVPADSRFPDHSIWQHNALCSALCSCMEISGDESEVGMMVFSITPVQQFIAKARKLRDYWTGSVLLSWLAFEGMRWVMENLGPDHVLYPSLIDQPLVNAYMRQNWKVGQDGSLNPPMDIASFPNKFLFLIPMNHAESIAHAIKNHIHGAWKELYAAVYDKLFSIMGSFLTEDHQKHIRNMFDRQNSRFWDLQWAAAHLVQASDQPEIERLLPENIYASPFKLMKKFGEMTKYKNMGQGVLYSVSHALAQAALAASKNRKMVEREPETGEKCHLCGEFEVLHHIKFSGENAKAYSQEAKAFWAELKIRWDGDDNNDIAYNLNKNEKLCSICLIKRMVCEAMKGSPDHILRSVLDRDGFPSTTHIALTSKFEKEHVPKEKQKEMAQRIHEKSDEKTDNHDRYYAILMMDGDKMGKLVNGETLGSTWESVMHPLMVERLKKPDFEKKYRDNWQEIFDAKQPRLVTPAIHAAISEALGDFSLYGVSEIIKSHNGSLIYAGGDDVCAVLPVETAFDAAQRIQEYYTAAYKWIQKDKKPEDISGSWTPGPGKLSINLGKGGEISISAAILVCHHKESLTHMLKEAHRLLDEKAKKEAGRNACAIALRKRSGGMRYFVRQWSEEKAWKSFSTIGEAINSKNKAQVSSSLVYRMEQLRNGVEAILKQDGWREMLQKLIFKQLERSSVGDKEQKEAFAEKMADLVILESKEGGREYKPDGLIVAAFMAKGGKGNGMV